MSSDIQVVKRNGVKDNLDFSQVKGSLQTFMRKLELGGVYWPYVNENFSTLAGQLNFLQKALTKEDVSFRF